MTMSQTIAELWGSLPIPGHTVKLPADFEGQDIGRWLAARPFDLVSLDDELESRMPFLWLEDEAAAYYLGAYALSAARQLETGTTEFDCDFAVSHMGHFLADQNGRGVLMLLASPFIDCLTELSGSLLQSKLSQSQSIHWHIFLTAQAPQNDG